MRSRSSTALCLADLDLTPGQETITVRTSKTWASPRTIPLLPALHPVLQEWLAHQADRELAASGLPLLATRHGTPLKTTFAWRLVKRVAYRAGIRPIPCTCHSQRQTRHQTGCPRTRNGHNLSHVTPHTLRRTLRHPSPQPRPPPRSRLQTPRPRHHHHHRTRLRPTPRRHHPPRTPPRTPTSRINTAHRPPGHSRHAQRNRQDFENRCSIH